ncbi:MAG TPA: SDR family oxidoreductase [Saprospiraceae bacterium]|nr:SDR family oxidoreductase [Saprospiraceae bacterium]HMQ81392.1 SDR family oxidoreductase [Saprospiraceae bacterium]
MEILSQKKIVLIGATGGIGQETARLLKSSGATLFLTGRNREVLDEIAAACQVPAENIFQLDITDPVAVQQVADNIHQQISQADILINAAGIGIIEPIDTLGFDDFDRVIDVNLKGSFYVLKAFLPPMKAAKKGLIIHIPGVLGKTPMAGAAAYAASKYGLNGMLKSIREELKRTDVRITNLYLGGVDTPFWDDIDLKVNRDKFIVAKEAARAIWFLCQQPSSGVVSELVIQPFNHQAI